MSKKITLSSGETLLTTDNPVLAMQVLQAMCNSTGLAAQPEVLPLSRQVPLNSILAADLPAIGQPLAGGTFFARHQVGDNYYALAFLGADSEVTGAWGEYGTLIEGADSFVDGVANTAAMIKAGSPIACKVNVDAGDYIPSYLEQALLLAYHKTKPGSGLEGRHWSSTQFSAHNAYTMDFEDGWQYYHAKDRERPVRLVRRVLIQ